MKKKEKKTNFKMVHLSLHNDVVEYYNDLAEKHGMTRNSVLQWVLANYRLRDLKW